MTVHSKICHLIFCLPGCSTARVFIVAVGYAGNKGVAIALLCCGVGVTGLNATGYAVNILDIAPKYAGVIIGISNVFGSMPGFISPQIVGYITTKNVSTNHDLLGLPYASFITTRYSWLHRCGVVT